MNTINESILNHHLGNYEFPKNITLNFTIFIEYFELVITATIGAVLGGASGWIVGFVFGKMYVEQFEPLYFQNLDELRQWLYLPHYVAQFSLGLGLLLGIVIILIIAMKIDAKQHILKLRRQGVTDTEKVAELMGLPVSDIQKVFDQMR